MLIMEHQQFLSLEFKPSQPCSKLIILFLSYFIRAVGAMILPFECFERLIAFPPLLARFRCDSGFIRPQSSSFTAVTVSDFSPLTLSLRFFCAIVHARQRCLKLCKSFGFEFCPVLGAQNRL